jgi:tetratricopeptide (TPR) repeat protein
MKRIVGTTLVILGVLAVAAAQTGTTPPPAQSTGGFQLSGSQHKPPPAPKTKEEGVAAQAVLANADPAAAETAAKDFEAKYPQSELSSAIYQKLMYQYQNSNNAEKTVDMGRKVLQFDADNAMSLVTIATVLAERTRESDLDRDQKLAEATKDAQHALDSMDTWLATAPGISDEQAQGAKPILTAMAHSALGMVEDNRKNPAAAEKHYRAAVEVNTAQPDAFTFLRLALALDAQKKYSEALGPANRAVELSAATPGMVADWAKQEQSRLSKLTGQTPAPAPATPPKS